MDAREQLEVEDEDGRQKRLGQLLMKVDQSGEKTLNAFAASAAPPINRGSGGLTPTPVEPPTHLLDRVQQFLPQLAESNASLSSRGERELDIENIGDGDPYYIEMNLGLGVFEYGRQGARSDDEESASSSSSSSPMSERDSEESDSSSQDSSSEHEDAAQVAARPKKPLPRRAGQNITVLITSSEGFRSRITKRRQRPPRPDLPAPSATRSFISKLWKQFYNLAALVMGALPG